MAQIWNKCTFLSVVLLLNVPLSGACFPGGQMVRRRPRRENPLLYNEHVPNTPEHSMEAAGRPEKPIRGASDPRYNDLVENYNENIIFKDKEDYSISRKMSRRCKEKLDTLAMLVMNQWPGVKLRVLKAWVQNKDFRPRPVPNSVLMHYEGRALDLTTSDMDRPKIGALARLAVQSGFDWVHFEHKSHIHVSVKSDILSRSTRSLRCFPGSSVVMNSDHKRKFMSDLNIGDQVTAFSMHTGQIVSSPIVAFLHLDTQTTINDYLRIRLSNSSLITLSPDHLLLSLESTHATNNESTQNSISCAKCTMKMARKLNFGDYVVTFGGKKPIFTKVLEIERVSARGLYAPLTLEGTILVDDVVASCYAGVKSHNLAHAALSPLRAIYSNKYLRRLFGYSNYAKTSEYIHWYANFLWTLADIIEATKLYSFFEA